MFHASDFNLTVGRSPKSWESMHDNAAHTYTSQSFASRTCMRYIRPSTAKEMQRNEKSLNLYFSAVAGIAQNSSIDDDNEQPSACCTFATAKRHRPRARVCPSENGFVRQENMSETRREERKEY